MTDAYTEQVGAAQTGMMFKSQDFTLQPLLSVSWH